MSLKILLGEGFMGVNDRDPNTSILVSVITFIPLVVICVVQTLSYKELCRARKTISTDSRVRIHQLQSIQRTFIVIVMAFFILTTPLTIISIYMQHTITFRF